MRNYLHPDLRKKSYTQWVNFLKETEAWDINRIREYQLNQIKRVTEYAYGNCRGYRSLYDSVAINPKELKNLEDFNKLPIITKELLRDDIKEYSVIKRGAHYITTGGSTGIPFGFYRNNDTFAKELASKAYQYYRIGWKEGCKQMILRGLVINSKNNMRNYPGFRELRCSSYHLTPEHLEQYRIKAFYYKPDFIKCYPSSGYIFAKFLKETGRPFPPLSGVLCASENLYDFQKKLLTEVFGCRIFNHYGHYEMAVLAGFCEFEDTFHVLPQYGYAQLVDKNGQQITKTGQLGEIIGTSFINTATPFIRYQTKDLAIFKGWGCPSCKRPYQIWERIEGRLQEFIITKTGRLISMTAINMHDNIFDHIKQFQFYQEKEGLTTFNFIPKESCNDIIIEDMKKKLLTKLGNDVILNMKKVDFIMPTKRGKHCFLIQKLKIKYGEKN